MLDRVPRPAGSLTAQASNNRVETGERAKGKLDATQETTAETSHRTQRKEARLQLTGSFSSP